MTSIRSGRKKRYPFLSTSILDKGVFSCYVGSEGSLERKVEGKERTMRGWWRVGL
jgi:hypothetical protein